MSNMKMDGQNAAWINRREFLRGTGAGVAIFHILPASLLRGAERLGGKCNGFYNL